MTAAIAVAKPRAKKASRRNAASERLLSQGNAKLGPGIATWSIPAITTCPGSTASCRLACYAMKNCFSWASVQDRYKANLERSMRPGFAAAMIAEIRQFRPGVVRIHVSGDIYDSVYATKWLKVIRKSPQTAFFMYSRSWRVHDILPVLRSMAVEPNMFLWLSIDKDTETPPEVPGARTAFMLESPDDEQLVPPGCGLVFRTHDKPPKKRVGTVLICPWEQGIVGKSGKIGCSRCTLCFSRPRKLSNSS